MDWKIFSLNLSNWLFLSFVVGIPLHGYLRKVQIYQVFVTGAKDGFELAIRITPYLVAIIVAVGMFRAAGGFTSLAHLFNPWLNKIGFPSELLPLALIRPFSGSAATGLFAEIAHTFGGGSYLAHAAGTMMGSTETTLYMIAIYFGAANIYRTRYAIPVGLLADLVGVISAVLVTHWFYS